MRPLIYPIRSRAEQEIPFVEGRINGGMVTTIDPADIANNQLVDAKNVRIRMDKTSRRHGHAYFENGIKPNSFKIMSLVNYKKFDGTDRLIRFAHPSDIRYLSGGAWILVAGVLTGGINDRFSTAVVNDRFFFTNGVDNVKELDITTNTHADAGNWDSYKYITGQYNRLVGANLTGGSPNPLRIGWSGDLNFTETDPSVDFSAGFEFLIESPSDAADFITGLVGFPSMLIIPKERSIWGGVKQPSASNPFRFQTIIPNIGCDCPYSIQKIPNGIAWVDFRTAEVYTYTIGDVLPKPIGMPINKTLISQIDSLETVFSDYNSKYREYSVCIPSSGTNVVRRWIYSFDNGAWSYDEVIGLSVVSSLDYVTGVMTYDELVGSYDGLQGSFNSLSNSVTRIVEFLGTTGGDILNEDSSLDVDGAVTLETIVESKIFTLPSNDMYVSQIRIDYLPQRAGEFTIQYRRDEDDWVTAKTETFTPSTKRQLVTYKKNLKCRQYQWRIVSSEGLFDLISFEVLAIPGARSTR